jgi:response regulator of citrate/malate metabolism
MTSVEPHHEAVDTLATEEQLLPCAECRVLIVEDDAIVAKVHHRYVSSTRGFTVAGIARSGGQARDMIQGLRPDVVLLDLELPGVSGLELLRDMRRGPDPTEVIVVSAHASPQLVRNCIQLGALDYLVKPFWVSRFAQALALVAVRANTFGQGPNLDQRSIDRIRGIADAPEAVTRLGISSDRLENVRDALAQAGQAMSAEQVAHRLGMSRVTARRYLEHLVYLGQCTVDSDSPGGPGRPCKFYRPWLSRPVGSVGLLLQSSDSE